MHKNNVLGNYNDLNTKNNQFSISSKFLVFSKFSERASFSQSNTPDAEHTINCAQPNDYMKLDHDRGKLGGDLFRALFFSEMSDDAKNW